MTGATIHGLATLVPAGHFPVPADRADLEATIAATVEAAFRRLAGCGRSAPRGNTPNGARH
jgi:hypothetical protein